MPVTVGCRQAAALPIGIVAPGVEALDAADALLFGVRDGSANILRGRLLAAKLIDRAARTGEAVTE